MEMFDRLSPVRRLILRESYLNVQIEDPNMPIDVVKAAVGKAEIRATVFDYPGHPMLRHNGRDYQPSYERLPARSTDIEADREQRAVEQGKKRVEPLPLDPDDYEEIE